MAVGLENEDRRFRRQLIEIGPGQLASRHDRGVQHLALDPGSRTGAGSRVADLLARFVHGGRREGADVQPGAQAGKIRMHVWINEARQDRVVAEIDRPGARSPQIHDVVAATSRDDPAIPDRDRLHNSIARVHGVDASGEEDRVGVTVIRGLRQRRSRSSHCGGEKPTTNAAQNVTTALKAPHDMHEALIAGITHRQSLSNQTTAVRGSKRRELGTDDYSTQRRVTLKNATVIWRQQHGVTADKFD